MKSHSTKTIPIILVTIFFFSLPLHANLRIMSYNIENFWLKFDGQSGTITSQGAELDRDDLKKLEIISGIIDKKEPDVIGILECASLGELIFFNERFLEESYRCWSFRAYDSRSYGIPLGIMVRQDLEVKSVELV